MNWKVLIVVCIQFVLSGCCKSEQEKKLDLVLSENPGLRSVLELYKNDSLKYKAALFLIDNMVYYRGVDGQCMESTYKTYEIFSSGKYTYMQALDSTENIYGKFDTRNIRWKEDIDMNPAYLVANIEWAFKVWKEQPWGKNVSFSQFCEYILPYRIGNEELIPWREKLYYEFMPIIEKYKDSPQIEEPTYAANIVLDSLLRVPFYFTGEMATNIRIGPRIVDWRGGSCLDLCDMLVYIYRALGIPCGIDELPLRGNNNAPHYWNFIVDHKGQTWYFSMFYWWHRLLEAEKYGDVYGKVIRHRFSLNEKMMKAMHTPVLKVHPVFRYPCFEDVTGLYAPQKAHTLSIKREFINSPLEMGDLIYLCMSNRLSWKPVDWTIYKGDSAVFSNCHGGTIFCLAVYDANNDVLKMISSPFSVNEENGKLRYYIPSEKTEEVILYSKFGMLGEFFIDRMVNGVFEGSSSCNFTLRDTLCLIKDTPKRLRTVVKVNTRKKYRYIRYYGPKDGYCNVSEIEFYERYHDSIPIKGNIIGPADGYSGDHSFFKAFDGSTETSYDYPIASGGWTGLDLLNKKKIEKIVYSPRNRDNFIRKGDLYELFVCINGNWKSVGLQQAHSDSLLFSKVPQNSLLFLRNHTRGIAERLFEYKNGKQCFW